MLALAWMVLAFAHAVAGIRHNSHRSIEIRSPPQERDSSPESGEILPDQRPTPITSLAKPTIPRESSTETLAQLAETYRQRHVQRQQQQRQTPPRQDRARPTGGSLAALVPPPPELSAPSEDRTREVARPRTRANSRSRSRSPTTPPWGTRARRNTETRPQPRYAGSGAVQRGPLWGGRGPRRQQSRPRLRRTSSEEIDPSWGPTHRNPVPSRGRARARGRGGRRRGADSRRIPGNIGGRFAQQGNPSPPTPPHQEGRPGQHVSGNIGGQLVQQGGNAAWPRPHQGGHPGPPSPTISNPRENTAVSALLRLSQTPPRQPSPTPPPHGNHSPARTMFSHL